MTNKYERLKFIVPDWDDIVDPGFDFINENNSLEYRTDKYKYGARIWHIYSDPPIDGVLISRSVIEPPTRKTESLKKKRIVNEGGVKKFFRLPNHLLTPEKFQVIGDCGAWQYINYDLPPYNPIDTLDFYQEIGVDYGVTVDHIAIIRDPNKRMQLTYENAIKSYDYWKEKYERGEYTFILLGAVQGIEIDDYIRFIEKLHKHGYRHFALGGLAKRNTNFIMKLISKLYDLSKRIDIEKLHFLGIARPRLAALLARLTDNVNEISFDNATYLRIAWSRSIGNYLSPNGMFYTAIRVRIGSSKEDEVLDALHRYDRGEISYDNVMNILREYTSLNGDTRYLPYYAKLLKDKPWKRCSCNICKNVGIDVVIFRRNDRNRRRGFHNLWVFYRLLKSGNLDKSKLVILPGEKSEEYYVDTSERLRVFSSKLSIVPKSIKRVLIITNCTMEKNVNWIPIIKLLESKGLSVPSFDLENEDTYRRILAPFMKPAKEMYLGTFKYVRKLEEVLRKSGVDVDIIIISARYGVIDADTPIIPYEATLKTLKDPELQEWSRKRRVVEKLREILSKGDYDLIIVSLPRSYIKPIKDIIRSLLEDPRSILLLPSTRLIEKASQQHRIKAVVVHTGNLPRRIEFLSLLRTYFEFLFQKQTTLDEYIN